MSVKNYLNRNKIGGLILIVVIVIAFGFGGFGGGFLSNNQNNIAKINKTNVTSQDLIKYINQSGISQKAIQDNLDNNIIEELLSNLVSTKLLELEIKNFEINLSNNSLSKKIRFNENFIDENGVFQRVKYEKFLLENNISAVLFEKRLRDRELQKKLFDFIGAGTISPGFLVAKLFENENKKLQIDFIDLEHFYKKADEINNQDLTRFINENVDRLKVDHLDFKYAVVNPMNLVGVDDFNQEFFDKIDQIENDILNGVKFDKIVSDYNLISKNVIDYKYSDESEQIIKRIYKLRNNNFDIIENGENFLIYKINNIQQKKPNINDTQTKKEILKLVIQKNKFDYNKNLLNQINDKKFTINDFTKLGQGKIQSLTLNSIKDNKKFEINSVKLLYSQPVNAYTLISDEKDKIYLAQIKNFIDVNLDKNTENYKLFINKENTRIRSSILKSYDLLLNEKYDVNINQVALSNFKNLFQ